MRRWLDRLRAWRVHRQQRLLSEEFWETWRIIAQKQYQGTPAVRIEGDAKASVDFERGAIWVQAWVLVDVPMDDD